MNAYIVKVVLPRSFDEDEPSGFSSEKPELEIDIRVSGPIGETIMLDLIDAITGESILIPDGTFLCTSDDIFLPLYGAMWCLERSAFASPNVQIHMWRFNKYVNEIGSFSEMWDELQAMRTISWKKY